MKRIPPKGTYEYRQYWRNRSLKSDIQNLVERMPPVIDDSTHDQQGYFQQAQQHLIAAHAAFKLGHELPYIKE